MSEFKFACPVCGQHITADASASGTQLECPTCFQKIVVPQAPASGDSKLILSAAQVGKPRPPAAWESNGSAPSKRSTASKLSLAGIALLVLAVASGAAVFIYKKHILSPGGDHAKAQTNAPAKTEAKAPPRVKHPVPKNLTWTLDPASADIPDERAVGAIQGSGFRCGYAALQGGRLSLHQAKEWAPEGQFVVLLRGVRAEELSDKTIEVAPDRPSPAVRVVVSWKHDQEKPTRREFTSGYLLKLAFGQVTDHKLPGRIYVCLPDDDKSFVAGTFVAQIRKPPPPGKGKGKAPR